MNNFLSLHWYDFDMALIAGERKHGDSLDSLSWAMHLFYAISVRSWKSIFPVDGDIRCIYGGLLVYSYILLLVVVFLFIVTYFDLNALHVLFWRKAHRLEGLVNSL